MIFELVRDFADALAAMPREHPRYRTLALLDEAVRRDLHFVDRHPTGLFQCMWNTCWWYDCPEAEEHYKSSTETGGADDTERGTVSVHLETWLTEKRERGLETPWLRSLRPPLVRSGGALKAVLRGHEWGGVKSVACSPDGQLIASSNGGEVRIWDAASGDQLTLIGLTTEDRRIQSVTFSPDSRRILTASGIVAEGSGNAVDIWDAATGGHIGSLHPPEEYPSGLKSVAYSPDGRYVAGVGYSDGSVRIWDPASEEEKACLRAEPRGGLSYVCPQSVAYSPDGERIVCGFSDRTVRIWHVARGEEIARLVGHEAGVTCAVFTPDGERIVSGSDDESVRIWRASIDTSPAVLDEHDSRIERMSFSADGAQVITVDTFHGVKVWDAVTGLHLVSLPRSEGLECAACSPDGRLVAAGFRDRTVRVWDVASLRQLSAFTGHDDFVNSLAFSPDGRHVASSGRCDGNVWIWEVLGARRVLRLRAGGSVFTAVAYSPDGRRIATGSWDETVRVWDVSTARQLAEFPFGESVDKVSFSQDGRRIVARSNHQTVRLWDVESGACVESVQCPQYQAETISAVDPRACWRVVRSGLESAVADVADGPTFAWFPEVMPKVYAAPTRPVWAGHCEDSGHLYLFTLEVGEDIVRRR